MFNLILVRYGEIALKSNYVRRQFEKTLVHNIRAGLKSAGLEYKVGRDFGRILIKGYNKKAESVLRKIFGIVSFSPAIEIQTEINTIKKDALRIAKKYIRKSDSFAVECNRVGNHSFRSHDIEKVVGAEVVKSVKCRVNLTEPDKIVGIDIRQDKTYIFSNSLKGPGGVPIGTAGRVVALIKDFNGIIASWMFMKRGCIVVPIFLNKNAKRHLKTFKKWYIGYPVKPYLLGKFYIKKIEKIAEERGALAIVLGESLEEFKNIKSRYTIFRPLVGLGKDGIKKLADTVQRT